jgi:hypothetical protein
MFDYIERQFYNVTRRCSTIVCSALLSSNARWHQLSWPFTKPAAA